MAASFKDRYAELFGETPAYDPINIDAPDSLAAPRRALNIQEAAPEIDAGGSFQPGTLAPKAIDPQQGLGGNIADLTKTGTAMLGEAVLGGGIYGTRQLAESDIMRGTAGSEIAKDVVGGLESGRGFLADYRQRVYDSMPVDAVQKKGAEFLTLDPDKTIWKGNPLDVGEAVLYKFWESVPMMAATLIPGAVMMRAGAAAKGITYLGASEGGLSVGFIANEITDGIQEMDDATLAKESPRFAELLNTTDPVAARQQLIAEAQGMAPIIGGVLVGAISATAGRYLEPVISGKANLGFTQRAARGALAEGVAQEGPQESVEQVASNIARAVYDGDLAALDGVAEAFVQGAVVGTPGGALAGGFAGRSAEPAEPTPESRSKPAGPRALPFGEVFGEQTPPPGGYTGAAALDLFEAEREAEEAAELERQIQDQVAPDVAAAVSAAIRQDNVMADMIDNIDFDPNQQNLNLTGGGMNAQGRDVATLPQQPPPDVPPGTQAQLPLEQRQRGVPPQDVSGAPPVIPQVEQPAVQGTVPTEQQGDLFDPIPEGQPDVPSAEPMGDIQAQLRDMENPESDREGVFLSADNVARLARDDLREEVGDVGVHLPNFDGEGGLLIAQDQEIADSVTELRDNGFPMQMIIGQVTQAGFGKPPAEGSAVVQLRDEQGNVLRETLQPEEKAYAMADELGDMAVVLSPQQAQKRRQQLIAKEQETARQQRAIRKELPIEERPEVQAAVQKGKTPKDATKAAANVLGVAVKKGKAERERAIGGFFPPNTLDFKGKANEKAYRDLWNQLVDNQLQQETAGTYPINRKADLKKEATKLFEQLGKVRQLERPTRKTTRVVKAAAAISPSTVATQRREASKKADKIDTSEKDYFAGEQFEAMTREEIDALSDTELATAFANAAYWLSGQFRKVEVTPEWLAENFEARDRSFAESIAEARGDPFLALSREYSTPGMQRKLLRRASNMVGQLGTAVESLPVTILAQRSAPQDESRPDKTKRKRQAGEVDPSLLARKTVPQDESRADEIKRKRRAGDVRKSLQTAVRQSNKFILRLENERSAFSRAYAEATDDIRDKARTAKAYFVALNQLALSMIESENQSTQSSNHIEKLDKRLRKIVKLAPKDFARQVATMAKADERKSLSAISDPTVREVALGSKRLTTIEGYYDTLRRNLAARDRMENMWKKNAYYNNLVGPLMQKFSDSIAVDGWASYRPDEAEMVYLEHAMHGWRTDEKFRKDFYDPLKRFFRGVGMEFETEKSKGAGGDLIIPKDEDGNYKWSSNDEALHQKLRATTSAQMASEYEITFTDPAELRPDAFNTQMAKTLATRETAATRADAVADAEQAAAENNVNRAIVAFAKIANNPKSTIQKLVKAEQALIKRLKKAGVWEDTPSKALGKIRMGTVKTYRKVGLPLLQKKISKQQARETMMKLKPYKSSFITPVKFTKTQAEKELELFSRMIDAAGNQADLAATAAGVGDILNDRTNPPSIDRVLDVMLQTLPEKHMYRTLANKLKSLGIGDTPVSYDWKGTSFKSSDGLSTATGKFTKVTDSQGQSTLIMLNRDRMAEKKKQGIDVGPNMIHTLLHEMVHAATWQALRNNPALRNTMLRLREEALLNWTKTFGANQPRPYGLTTVTDKKGEQIADEFVAEAMSNPEFQAALKQIYLDGRSVWRRFVDLVRNALNMGDAPVSIFDAIMSLESQLFAGAEANTVGGDVSLAMMDSAVSGTVSQVMDRVQGTTGALNRIWSSVKPPLMAMTMEQIRDTYQGYFGGTTAGLGQYMRAFFQRNARNTQLMSEAETLTRQWTKLNEEAGTQGEAFSTLATEATLNSVAANLPLSHEANSHLSSPEQQAKHRELHREFNAMSAGYKKLYNDLQKFYREALERETGLMTLNALRGVLTKGADRFMTKKEFEAKYTLETISKFDNKEKMKAEFGEFLDDDMISTLSQMANLRQKRQGNYFPIKRYGEYVVAAEREVQKKSFDDRKEAFGFAAERRATDATLVVETKKKDGGWEVTVTEKEFSMAETPTKAEEIRARMIEEYGEDPVSTVQRKTPKVKATAIESNQALNSILVTLKDNKAAQNAIKQFYLDSLSDASFRKHEMRRKNRKGADGKLQLRNFTSYAKQSAYYSAQLEFGHKMADGIQEMNDYIREHRDESDITAVRLSEVRDEIVKRDEMQVDPDEILAGVRKAVEYTQFAMLTSPSYWMINASQPWMVTMPWLTSKYGMGRSLASLKNAQNLIISPLVRAAKDSKGGLSALRSKVAAENAFNVLDDVLDSIKERDPANYPEYKAMLEQLRENSVIDLSWIAELRDISEGTDTGRWQKMLDASRVMAHLTEVNNRILTAVATYDLAKQEAIDKGLQPESVIPYAVKTAQQAVSETQFNYSSPNKPRLFQPGGPLGKGGPMIFQFMQWPQHMYAMMIKNMHQAVKGGTDAQKAEARKLLLGLFGTHLAAGGILGAALQPVKWAIGLTMMAFGDEDDTLANAVSGESFDRAVTRATVELFGSEIGGVLAKGLPTAVGADLSQRMSLGTVYFIDFKSDNAESALGSLALGLGGASLNLAANTWRGIQDISRGNIMRGIERGSPKMLRDVLRTGRYWREGLVNNAGDTVIPGEGIGIKDLFLQSMGVQPYQVSQFYQGQQAIKDTERYYRDRKSDILKDFRTASTAEDRAAVLRNVAEFNRKNPALAITRSALIQSVTSKYEREARYRRYGANIDEKAATQFAKEGDPYR